jgi:NAD-dependent deacetylase
VYFQIKLIPEDLKHAEELALSCDLMIVAGSTLEVQPAASFPLIAKSNGATLAIITQSDTPLDSAADFVFHEKLGGFIDTLTN